MPSQSSRSSVLDDLGDKNAEPGSKPWAMYMLRQAKYQISKLDSDAKCLALFVESLNEHQGWKVLGFLSLDVLCESELHLSAAEVLAVRKAKRGESLRSILGRDLAADPDVKPLAEANTTGRNNSTVDNVNGRPTGNSASYIVRRLKRDAPDIAAQLAAGEYRSARAAGIAAGIVKVPTALQVVQKAFEKLTTGERKQFDQWRANL